MFSPVNNYFELVEKLCFIAGAVSYFVFAFVVVKQTSMMAKNVNDKFNNVLIAFSWLHVLFAIVLVFLTLLL